MPARPRSFSPQTRDAALLLGSLIQIARRERGMTEQELADRIGASRPTVRRIERGDLGVGLGLAFEAASVLGIALFNAPARLAQELELSAARLALLPDRVRPRPTDVNDDF